MARLGDICTIQSGGTPSRSNKEYWDNGTIPWVKISDFSGKHLDHTSEKITQAGLDGSSAKIFPKGTILYTIFATLGETCILDIDATTNQAIAGLKLNDDSVLIDYLYYYLLSIKEYVNKIGRGVAQNNINMKILREMEITIPSKEVQKRITDTLNKVYTLIALRKEQLAKLDRLVKSRFIELFGDPVSNSKRLPELTLPELGEFGRGVSKHRPRNDPKLLGGKYPLIQTGEVANSNLYITEYASTYSELGFQQSKLWQKGTLCITIAANIAKTAILTFDACFPDSVVGFKANEKTNNIFIHYWFSFFQAILEEQAPESAQKNINLKILSELKIIVPPIKEQNEFAAFVEQTDKSKLAIQQSLDKLESLKKSLMEECFGQNMVEPELSKN